MTEIVYRRVGQCLSVDATGPTTLPKINAANAAHARRGHSANIDPAAVHALTQIAALPTREVAAANAKSSPCRLMTGLSPRAIRRRFSSSGRFCHAVGIGAGI